MLLEHLPFGGAFDRAIHYRGAEWGTLEELVAIQIEETHRLAQLTLGVNGGKPSKRPFEITRPWKEERQVVERKPTLDEIARRFGFDISKAKKLKKKRVSNDGP